MIKSITDTTRAPKAIGPYSQAVQAAGTESLLFVSGQIPINPDTGKIVPGGIEEQMKQVIQNLRAILEEDGYKLADIIKVTIFLNDLKDFDIVNNLYAGMFTGEYPARSCIGGLTLPKGALVEIEAIAVK